MADFSTIIVGLLAMLETLGGSYFANSKTMVVVKQKNARCERGYGPLF